MPVNHHKTEFYRLPFMILSPLSKPVSLACFFETQNLQILQVSLMLQNFFPSLPKICFLLIISYV
jgi:hypothetical protein